LSKKVPRSNTATATRAVTRTSRSRHGDVDIPSRDQILESVWGAVSESRANTLEVLMARIRRKLGGATAPIRTVRNLGYSLDEP